MAGPDLLHRRYRQLLRAYPCWYRRERGQEMLTTLLDAARPDQQRPTGRETLDLICQGTWLRLRLPHKPGYWIVTVTVASFAMLVGLAIAGALVRASTAPAHTHEARAAITGATAAVLAAGALVGLLAGWLVMSWVLQRYRRQPNLVKVAIALFNVPILAIMLAWWLFLTDHAVTGTGSATPTVLVPANALIKLVPSVDPTTDRHRRGRRARGRRAAQVRSAATVRSSNHQTRASVLAGSRVMHS